MVPRLRLSLCRNGRSLPVFSSITWPTTVRSLHGGSCAGPTVRVGSVRKPVTTTRELLFPNKEAPTENCLPSAHEHARRVLLELVADSACPWSALPEIPYRPARRTQVNRLMTWRGMARVPGRDRPRLRKVIDLLHR